LGFQVRDRVADHRISPVQRTRGSGETARIHDGEKDPELIEGGCAGLGCHVDFLEQERRKMVMLAAGKQNMTYAIEPKLTFANLIV
jgi:hypothetical protein